MKEIKNEKKTSRLVFDMRAVRTLLKMNGEPKYCPYCGKALAENCACHKNIIIDVKKARGTENATVAVFLNNESFKKDLDSVASDSKQKEGTKDQNEPTVVYEFEPIEIDLG